MNIIKRNSIIFGYTLSLTNMLLVYFSGGTSAAYPNFNYIPIAIVASNCGKNKGMIHAFFTAILMGPLMPLYTEGNVMQKSSGMLIRAGTYVTIAWIIGFFAELNEQKNKEMNLMLSKDQATGFFNTNSLRGELPVCLDRTGFIAVTVKDYEALFGFFGIRFSASLVKEYARIIKELFEDFENIKIYRHHGLNIVIRVDSACDKIMKQTSDKLQSIHGKTIIVEDVPLYIEIRMGIAFSYQDVTLERGLRSSIMALHKAISTNNILYEYSKKDEELYNNLTRTASKFYRALKNREIKVAFQKIIHTSGGKSAYELLARWSTDEGFIPPDKFIPIIERSDLINELTRLVVRSAVDFAFSQGEDMEFVSINFSINSLSMHNILFMDELVKAKGIDPNMIVIEVTEQVFVDTDLVIDIIGAASDMGYRIAIDDFGSGYSSYKYIDIFPIDIIKIDSNIINHMQTSQKTRNIVKSIVNLSKENAMMTVAEGIETEVLAKRCIKLGFDYLQGFLYHKPEIIKE